MLEISKPVTHHDDLSFQSPRHMSHTFQGPPIGCRGSSLQLLYSWKHAPAPPPCTSLWQQLLSRKAHRQAGSPEIVMVVKELDLNLNTANITWAQ